MAVILHTLFSTTELPFGRKFDAGDREGARRTSLAQLSWSDASHFRLSQLDRRHMYGPVITTISLSTAATAVSGNPISQNAKRDAQKTFRYSACTEPGAISR